MKKLVSLFILMLILSSYGFTQRNSLPVVAVTNIEAVDVPTFVANACREMVETALIKTGKYQVMNYANMKEVLEAQSFSLSGCTDEACAVEIGKLLSAEQIVLGTLSSIEDKMLLSLRIIDVETGKHIAAEIVSIESMDTLQDGAFSGTYKMAGLKYIKDSEVTISENGSIYVTAPEGKTLTILLDGIEKGQTPILLEDITFGTHLLTAKGENYLFEDEISITSKDILEISVDISLLKGNIILKTFPTDALGFFLHIDGIQKNTGLVRDLSIGEHYLEIKGNGWFYDNIIIVEKNITKTVTINLESVGELTIHNPKDILVQVFDIDGNKILESENINEVELSAGKYRYIIDHPDYELLEQEIDITRGQHSEFSPLLVNSKLYKGRELLAGYEAELARLNKSKKVANILGYSLAGLGILSAGSAGLFEYLVYSDTGLMDTTYQAYLDTEITAEASVLWNEVEDYKVSIDGNRSLRTVSVVSAGVFIIGSLISFFLKPNTSEIENEINILQGGLEL
jgi:TolB-like protein